MKNSGEITSLSASHQQVVPLPHFARPYRRDNRVAGATAVGTLTPAPRAVVAEHAWIADAARPRHRRRAHTPRDGCPPETGRRAGRSSSPLWANKDIGTAGRNFQRRFPSRRITEASHEKLIRAGITVALFFLNLAAALAQLVPGPFEVFRHRADQGDADAQLILGSCTTAPMGLCRCGGLVSKAADQGLAAAEHKLGFMYIWPWCTAGYAAAVGWYRRRPIRATLALKPTRDHVPIWPWCAAG